MSDVDESARSPSPGASDLDPGATLAAWRERGAHRRDPVRFRFIEALAQRAAAHDGEARRVLDGKLAQALRAYAEKLACVAAPAEADGGHGRAAAEGQGPLADLMRDITAGVAMPGELKALTHFRSTWSRLSADQRLSQSRAKVPGNAGPLHSHALVLRSLTLMRELSPDYLSRFMSHIDALLWLEQANGGRLAVPQDIVRAEGDKPRKAARGKPG